MRPNAKSGTYLHSLDGWRAIAVLMVVFDHAQPFQSPLRYLQGAGGLGVRIFFAISGLLICSRLLEEEAIYGRISLRSFYIRRAFRILPASLFFLATVAILSAISFMPADHDAWWAALCFYRNYYGFFHGVDRNGWFTAHFWSLSVEEHFYFLLPSILVFFRKTRQWVLLGMAMLSFGWAAAYIVRLGNGVLNPLWYQRTEFCLVSLLLPAAMVIWLRDPVKKKLTTRLLPAWVTLPLLALCVTRWIHPFPTLAEDEVWSLGLKSAVFPLILLSTVLHPASWLTKALEWAPLRFVGRISYSWYLWQELFLTREFTYPEFALHHLQNPAAGMACSFALAALSYFVVEMPLIRMARRFDNRKPLPVQFLDRGAESTA